MSTSLVHVLTVIGKAAEEVEAACEDLLGRRVQRHAKCYGTEDWSPADHEALADLCTSVLKGVHNLPIVYYAQYLDPCDVADSKFGLLEWPDGRKRYIYGTSFGLVFYPSEFSQDLLTQIKKYRRRKLYRHQTEDRWFLDHLGEAIHSALWLEVPFLVVSISQCLGPSRLDEEIRAALDVSIKLTDH